jgi:50S ribosomal subunit-associated GTPase HflX
MLQTLYPEAVCISAKAGIGLDKLAAAVVNRYKGGEVVLRVVYSQADGKVHSYLRAFGRILEERFDDGSIICDVRLGKNQVAGLENAGRGAVRISALS